MQLGAPSQIHNRKMESDMASTTLNRMNSTHADTDQEGHGHGLLAELSERIATWRRRSRERETLAHMTDIDLADLGISRVDAEIEAAKPFWRA